MLKRNTAIFQGKKRGEEAEGNVTGKVVRGNRDARGKIECKYATKRGKL